MTVTINGTTGVAVPLGSVSAPGVSNTTSSTTGIYNPTGTTLGIATNGVNAVYVDASQNVGIAGTPNVNTTSKLFSFGDITRSGASGGFLFNLQYSSANARWEYAGTGTGAGWIDSGSGNYTFQSTGSTSGTNGSAASTLTERMRIDSSGIITGTAGNLMLVQSSVQNTTSGTTVTFTGIPSWAKRILVMINGVSTNGASGVQIQLGSGSLTTTGYNSGSTRFGSSALGSANSTSGFLINVVNASTPIYGSMIISNVSGNIWVSSFSVGCNTNANYAFTGGGQISLAGTLDRVAIVTANLVDLFNAGSINIQYE